MKKALALVLACSSMLCIAQESSHLQGSWIAKYALHNGTAREAKVRVAGNAGTWQILATNRNDACLGKEAPIALTEIAMDTFTMKVQNSKALAGCTDFEYHFTRKSEREFSGQLMDGRAISLTRE